MYFVILISMECFINRSISLTTQEQRFLYPFLADVPILYRTSENLWFSGVLLLLLFFFGGGGGYEMGAFARNGLTSSTC